VPGGGGEHLADPRRIEPLEDPGDQPRRSSGYPTNWNPAIALPSSVTRRKLPPTRRSSFPVPSTSPDTAPITGPIFTTFPRTGAGTSPALPRCSGRPLPPEAGVQDQLARRRLPVTVRKQITSPAAKIPGNDVSIPAPTGMPSARSGPPPSRNSVFGTTPVARTTASHGTTVPSESCRARTVSPPSPRSRRSGPQARTSLPPLQGGAAVAPPRPRGAS